MMILSQAGLGGGLADYPGDGPHAAHRLEHSETDPQGPRAQRGKDRALERGGVAADQGDGPQGAAHAGFRLREPAAWLDAFLGRAEVLAPALSTLPHYAAIRHELKLAGSPIPANDCWIAALVREYKMPIVSKDTHFDWVSGIRRLDW